jgi:hypothetical protein
VTNKEMRPSSLIIDVPKWVLRTLNNLYDIERKLAVHGDSGNVSRNVAQIKDAFTEGLHLFYEDPSGQAFNETRTDLEASITGVGADNLKVVEVIKPIIRYGEPASSRVVQKGVVIVKESTHEEA